MKILMFICCTIIVISGCQRNDSLKNVTISPKIYTHGDTLFLKWSFKKNSTSKNLIIPALFAFRRLDGDDHRKYEFKVDYQITSLYKDENRTIVVPYKYLKQIPDFSQDTVLQDYEVNFFFLFLFAGCKRGNHQIILLRNLSSEDIYFLTSKIKILTDPDGIANIRPAIPWALSKIKIDQKDREEAKITKLSLYRNLIERDSLEVILTSESAAIFVDAVTIQSIIKDRFGGQINIFIISANDLQSYSDQEIIDQKLYRFFKTLTIEDIRSDTLTLEYQ